MAARIDARGVCTGCRMLAADCICPLDFDPQAAVREHLPSGPLTGGIVWPPADPHAPLDFSARRDFERLREQLDQATVLRWRLDRLAVVGRTRCERCQADHDVYAVREAS
ncbi:MAG TPA: hypothetical protein VG276_28965 [Actinomycetes bacterium]|jgi:hypothetical protein|nr:hypothetical protein [Actinomycetes bacterium]